MEEQSGNGDELRHECKLCRKSFSSGRSLGGHMRSHSMNNSFDSKPSPETTNGCGLRANQRKRKKQRGLDFDKDPSSISQPCEVCGRKFSSWKALLAHAMKSHLVDDINDSSKEEEEDEEEPGCRDSQSSHNDSGLPNRKKRSKRRKRFSTIKVLNSSSFSTRVSKIEQELEDVAMCLMMLSRDSSSAMEADSSDKNSITFFHDDPTPSAVNSSPKISISGKSGSRSRGNEDDPNQSRVKAGGVTWSPSKRKFSNCPESGFDRDTEKGRFRFECNTCGKVFQSYQALGGHRAGHRKSKSKSTDCTQLEEEEEQKKREGDHDHHECPVCLKVFPSGQALGGHKKSHFLPSIPKPKVVDQAREFIDLNLPAPIEDEEEEEEESSSNVNFISGMLLASI